MNGIKGTAAEGSGRIAGDPEAGVPASDPLATARPGRRVLRPGGIELTREMLGALGIEPSDEVVELALEEDEPGEGFVLSCVGYAGGGCASRTHREGELYGEE